MIVKESDVLKRLNSPMNLMNRLRRENTNDKKNSVMSLFGIGREKEREVNDATTSGLHDNSGVKHPDTNTSISFNPFQKSLQPVAAPTETETTKESSTLDTILSGNEAQIKLGLAHDNAIKLLNNSIDALTLKLDDVKADKLPSVIAAAAKTVEGIRRERNEAAKNNKDRDVHFHFYTPEQKKVTDYEVIDVV